ncbi:MAG: LysR substrate-binding domain-containing protein [Polaromonas sp.]|uniref:LysR family transcriptional regulator n=1 Tax=Polaromonas sp. TaxID=1869339 RepID=UPI003265A625
MRFHKYEAINAVFLCGTVTGAAKMLNLSQPAVSRLISSAESELGFLLFHRQQGRMAPTDEAQQLRPAILRIMESMSHASSLAAGLRNGGVKQLRIAAVPSLATAVLPRAVKSFIGQYPKCKLTLETYHYDSLVDALLAGHVDLGFVYEPVAHAALATTDLLQAFFCSVSTSGYFAKSKTSISIKDLGSCNMIGLSKDDLVASLIAQTDGMADIALTRNVSVETSVVAMHLAAQGMGVALVDSLTGALGKMHGAQVLPFTPEVPIRVSAMRLVTHEAGLHETKFMEHFAAQARLIHGG